MSFYIPYSEDYLSHSGTKGMKWGVRRWQNYDGSLTEAGRIRYGRGDKLSRLERKAARMERKADRMDAKALKRRAKADRKARWEKKPFLRHLVRTDDVTAKLREAQRLEKKAARKRKKEEKLQKKIEELKKQKLSEFDADTLEKLSVTDLDGDARPSRSYDPERSETTLKDYVKSGKAEKNMKSEFDKMRNNSKTDEEKDRKVAMFEKARDQDRWDIDFMEEVQNTKALDEGDTTTLLREYAKYLDHPQAYIENDEAGKLKRV